LNKEQKKIVKEARKRYLENIVSNNEESFRKSRIEVKRSKKVKNI
jgi:hypothetical protein